MRSLVPLIICCMLVLPSHTHAPTYPTDLTHPVVPSPTETNATDIWMELSLISWQADTSVEWDTDGTDIDPQFRICFNVDAETDGVPETCEFTQIWQDTVSLTSGINLSFDVPEDFEHVLFTIECWDNDDESDEWNNGPDACDLNSDDSQRKFSIEADSNQTGTLQVNGSGFGDSNSLGSKGDAEISISLTVDHILDSDDDGVFDNLDECANSSGSNPVDEYGCAWADLDFNSDGIANGIDPCSYVAQQCGHSRNDFILGQRKTLLDAFGRTNQFTTHFQQIPSDLYAREPCTQWRLARINLSEMTFSCTWDPVDTEGNGGLRSFDSTFNRSVMVFSHEIQTGHWATQYDVLRTPWGTYSPTSYCCEQNGEAQIRPWISPVEISDDGKFVVWVEQHDSFDEIWMWKQGEEPSKIHNITRGDDWLSFAGTGNVELTPDGRYLLLGHRNDAQLGKSIILDLGTEQTVAELECISVALAHNSNTLACMTNQRVEIISIETNSSMFGFTISQSVADLRYSPSDNHLIIKESMNNGVQVVNLQTGNIVDLVPPSKDGFYQPSVQFATFIDSDFTIVAFVDYFAIDPPSNSGSTYHRHEIITYGLDLDGDGVIAFHDECKDTQALMAVDSSGCSDSQRDTDLDGVSDLHDQCPSTQSGADVDELGCADDQIDSDMDGVLDVHDECPSTSPGEAVGFTGCSASQRDSDGDGIVDSHDSCPGTPLAQSADSNGCGASQKDTDLDGVVDSSDACPNSTSGAEVDTHGCDDTQRDSDGDGIIDRDDDCPDTQVGAFVDLVGCGPSERDSDNDGIVDSVDQCPSTPPSNTVGTDGCSSTQVDTDGDGLNDADDDCPHTPSGVAIDQTGCATNGTDVPDPDSDMDGVFDSRDECRGTPNGVIVEETGCSVNSSNDAASDNSVLLGIVLLVGVGAVVLSLFGRVLRSGVDDYDDDEYDDDDWNFSPRIPNTPPTTQQNVAIDDAAIRSEMESILLELEEEFLDRQQHSTSQLTALQLELAEMRATLVQSEEERQLALEQISELQNQQEQTLKLQDSVVTGDAMVGSTKIEQQVIHNDPEAMIRMFKELKAMFNDDEN